MKIEPRYRSSANEIIASFCNGVVTDESRKCVDWTSYKILHNGEKLELLLNFQNEPDLSKIKQSIVKNSLENRTVTKVICRKKSGKLSEVVSQLVVCYELELLFQ